MKTNQIIMVAVLVIIVGGGAFFGGMKYQQSKAPQGFNRGQFGGSQQGQGLNRGRAGGGAVMGSISSADSNSITVKMQDGSSKFVILSDTTKINKAADATKSDLSIGQTVSVFGITNSDGSVTAQNIQLNPLVRQQAAGSATPTK